MKNNRKTKSRLKLSCQVEDKHLIKNLDNHLGNQKADQ